MATRKAKASASVNGVVVSVAVAASLLGRPVSDVQSMLRKRVFTPAKHGKASDGVFLQELITLRHDYWTSLTDLAVHFIRAVESESLELALREAGLLIVAPEVAD
ncbi:MULTISPECIES: hypothetical protein [unclassified Caballeronia]|uniref:hypothetical protein n=1 Tax=unclassified Caballeronia TaxID=2646786 RepID=UPI002028BCDA|nr:MULTISPECIES: hypothetical protein [unclassified Caballeronia]MDR5768096.1 hypothetical protein [Caballeronia sp. LZ028]